LTTYVNLCWVIGQLLASGILKGFVTGKTQWSYRIPYAIQWIWPVPIFIVAFFAPESPWLVSLTILFQLRTTNSSVTGGSFATARLIKLVQRSCG
jgi:Sugar (and other) transporter